MQSDINIVTTEQPCHQPERKTKTQIEVTHNDTHTQPNKKCQRREEIQGEDGVGKSVNAGMSA